VAASGRRREDGRVSAQCRGIGGGCHGLGERRGDQTPGACERREGAVDVRSPGEIFEHIFSPLRTF
jgi:hypothetical protein